MAPRRFSIKAAAVAAVAVTAVFFTATVDAATSGPVIKGIYPTSGGIYGGTRLTISGTGFDERGRSNDIFIGNSGELEGSAAGGVFCDPVPNECHTTRIVCLTGDASAVPHVRGKLPLQVRAFGFVASCGKSSGCTFEYTHYGAPVVTRIAPSWVADPSMMTISGKQFAQGDVTVGSFDYSFHIGEEERCNVESNPVSWSSSKCQLDAIPFAGHQKVAIQMGTKGNAKIAKEFQTVLVVPTIQNVVPAAGSTAGGTRLTVYGTAFSKDATANKVTVHGKPCPVLESNEEYLVCLTQPSAATSAAVKAPVAGKTKAEFWHNIVYRNIARFHEDARFLTPSETKLVDMLGGNNQFQYGDNAAMRLTTMFTPNVTGNYTFYVGGDDSAELWLALDETPVRRVVTAITDFDPTYARRLAYTDYYTSNNFGVYDTQMSKPQYLEAGRKYWLQTVTSNAGSAMGTYVKIKYQTSVTSNWTTIANGVIPSDYIAYQPDWMSPVKVVTGGTTAIMGKDCLAWGSCDFHYAAASTPTVTGTTPATAAMGQTLTISGAGFSAMAKANEVLIAGVPCIATAASTTTQVVCVPAQSVPAGRHRVLVRVNGKGAAAGSVVVDSSISVTSVSSVGAAVTVTGKGFAALGSTAAVTIAGQACAVTSLAETEIQCTAAAALPTTAGAAVNVSGSSYSISNLSRGMTFEQAFVRPGTTKAPGAASSWPAKGGMTGETILNVMVPAWRFESKTDVEIMVGSMPCPVFAAIGSRAWCATPYTTTAATHNVTVKNVATSKSLVVGTFEFEAFVRWLEPRYAASRFGGVELRFAIDYVPNGRVTKDEVAVKWFNQPCPVSYLSASSLDVRCIAPAMPTSTPTLPVLADYNAAAADISSKVAMSTGVRATGGAFAIPAGGGYVYSRQKFSRPVAVSATITPSGAATSSSKSWIRVYAFSEDPTAIYSGMFFGGGTESGSKLLWELRLDTWRSNSAVEGEGDFENTKLVANTAMNWRLEAWPGVVRCYIGDVLVLERYDATTYSGFVGISTGRAVTIKNFKVSSLDALNLQVTVQGKPVKATTYTPAFASVETRKITGFTPTTVKGGDVMTVLGSSISTGSRSLVNVWVADRGAAVSTWPQAKHGWRAICSTDNFTSSDSYTCQVSNSVPAGLYTAYYMHAYKGFASKTVDITVNADVTSVSPSTLALTGGMITINGKGFSTDSSKSTVTVGGAACAVLATSETTIVCRAAAVTAAKSGATIAVTQNTRAASMCAQCSVSFNTTSSSPTATVEAWSTPLSNAQDGIFRFSGTNLKNARVMIGGQWCRTTYSSNSRVDCSPTQQGFTHNTAAQTATILAPSGVATASVQLSGNVGAVYPTAGSAGNVLTIKGAAFQVQAGTSVDNSDLTSALRGWTLTGALEQYSTYSSPAGAVLGPLFQFAKLSKTMTSLASHTALTVRVRAVAIDDWSINVDEIIVAVDGVEYPFTWRSMMQVPRRINAGIKGGGWDYVLDMPFTVPHTAASAKVEIYTRGVYSRAWGVMRAQVGILATEEFSATVGGVACPVSYHDAELIKCTVPTATPTGVQTVALKKGAAAVACATDSECTYNMSAVNGPVVTGVSVMPPASAGQQLDWVTSPQVIASSGGDAMAQMITKTSDSGNTWNGQVQSLQTWFGGAADGFEGVEFEFEKGIGMVGLSFVEENSYRTWTSAYWDIDAAWYFHQPNNKVYVYMRGSYEREWVYVPGTRYSIKFVPATNTVLFIADGTHVMHTTSFRPMTNNRFPVRIEASLHNAGTTVKSFKIVTATGAPATSTQQMLVVSGKNLGVNKHDTELLHTAPTVTIGAGQKCRLHYASAEQIVCAPVGAAVAMGATTATVTSRFGTASNVAVTVGATVFSTSVMTGGIAGGQVVTVLGAGFTAASTVSFGGTPAAAVISRTASALVVTTPTMAEGTHAVTVSGATCAATPYSGASAMCPTFFANASKNSAVTSAAPTVMVVGQEVTFTGTFPDTDMKTTSVLIGTTGTCAVSAVSSTMVKCTVNDDVTGADSAVATLRFKSASAATVAVSVKLAITGSSTIAVGHLGGAKITITGTGFGTAAPALQKADTTALCQSVTRVSGTKFVCLTAAMTFTIAAAADMKIVVPGKTADAGFFDGTSVAVLSMTAGNAPSVASVTAKAGRGDSIVVTGANVQTAYKVMVGSAMCKVTATTATTATCMIDGNLVADAANAVELWTAAGGKATGAASVMGVLKIASVSPALAAPGATLTIYASGVKSSTSDHTVKINNLDCAVTAVDAAAGTVQCTVPTPAKYVGVPVDVLMFSNAKTVTATGTFDYTKIDPAVVTAVSPTSASAAGGDLLTITGTGFHATPAMNTVMVGGKRCTVMSGTTTQLTCMTAAVAAPTATAAISVVKMGVASTGAVTVDLQLAISNVQVQGGAKVVSVEGGLELTVTGTGFPVAETKYAKVTVGGRACPITGTSATQITCTLPGAARERIIDPAVVSAFVARPEGQHAVYVVVNGTNASTVAANAIEYKTTSTPTITSVTGIDTNVFTNSKITITGTGFAASGNVVAFVPVKFGVANSSTCAVESQSATQIICQATVSTFGAHRVVVTVPGKGRAMTSKQCPAGTYLMCDGSCIPEADCTVAEWGVTGNCQQLAKTILHETFCHSNGGSDRVNIPMRTDTGKVFDLNCPMYSCEGGDCESSLSIGGVGAVVSTCGADPNGAVATLRAIITGVSSASKISGTNGGLRVTITGRSLSGTGTTVGFVGGVCTPVSTTDSQIVCETSASAVEGAGKVEVFRRGSLAHCTTACEGFSYAAASNPAVTAAAPTSSSRALCVSGETITLTGTNFATTAAENIVTVGGVAAPVSAATATEIRATCPDVENGYYPLHVRVAGKGTASLSVTEVRVRPTIKSVTPNEGSLEGGAMVTIGGAGFSPAKGVVVQFGSCVSVVKSVTTTQIVAQTTKCTSRQTIKVTSLKDAQTSQCMEAGSNACRHRFATAPTVTGITVAGSTVTVTADFTGKAQADLEVTIGSAVCAITAFSTTGLTCTAAATHAAGTYLVRVRFVGTGFATPTSTGVVVYAGSISAVSPTVGSLGGNQKVTISGQNFGTAAADVAVAIGAVSCAVQSVAAAQIICVTPATTAAFSAKVNVTIDTVNSDAVSFVSAASYEYSAAATPSVSTIAPTQGSTEGGTEITITGTSFSAAASTVTVGGAACTMDSAQQSRASATQMFCTTSAMGKTVEGAAIRVTTVAGDAVIAAGVAYDFIDLWSRWTTWGNTAPPVQGDSVVISEGQMVQLDYSPPRMNLIIVMGHLKFDQTKDITLECVYVMINFGRFTVGTPDKPFMKKATIRLYGDRLTPEIPVHGAKVVALRHGALDMHGIERKPTWTTLTGHAEIDATQITITGPVDWAAGEEIVIASTDYKMEHAERRVISAVLNGASPVVTVQFEEPLEHRHFGERQCFGPGTGENCIDEVAEVILLTRNIVVEGDEDTHRLGFGGTLFLMPLGQRDDRYARLSYVELRDVGQQYIVGRYPVHFHVTHDINNSYVNGTSVHRSLNRAYSIHGTNNNTYVNNVVYDTHGHSFFIEDGSEKFNVIENNVVIKSRSSTSNLNTDITPANFWCVSPLNKISNNRAAGSHSYGFWISPFHPHSTGPTHSTSICPSTHQMWEFNNNVAHSNGKYGLNVFRFWWPKVKECDHNSDDAPAVIKHLTSWKNKIHGVTSAHSEVGQIGSVTWDNLTSADNGHEHADAAAFWTEKVKAANMTFGVTNSLLIAVTNNAPHTRTKAGNAKNRRGINLPLGDNFFSENVTFVNYGGDNYAFEPQAWAERFSFCFPWGWEAVSRGLKWIDSPNRALFRFVHHGILSDEDGTLTGTAGAQLVPKAPIFDPAVCSDFGFNTKQPSIVCNGRRIHRFDVSQMSNVWKDQIWTCEGRSELVPEIKHKYSVTAHTKAHYDINFSHLFSPDAFDWNLNQRFIQPGENYILSTFYQEQPDHIKVKFNGKYVNASESSALVSLEATEPAWHAVAAGNFSAVLTPGTRRIDVEKHMCPEGGCPTTPLNPAPVSKPCEPFDLAASWENYTTIPGDNAQVHITWKDNICFNRASGVYNFDTLLVEGTLTITNAHCPSNGAAIKIKTKKWVHVRGGYVLIGTKAEPLTQCKVEITMDTVDASNLNAHYRLPWGTRTFAFEAGRVEMFGKRPEPVFARLAHDATVGATTLRLDAAVQWAAGDVIVVAGTERQTEFLTSKQRVETSEEATIASVAGTTVTLTAGLKSAHRGGTRNINGITYAYGAEVTVVSRNIVMNGGHAAGETPAFGVGWAFSVGCTDGIWAGCGDPQKGSTMSKTKTGDLKMDAVQFMDIGQEGPRHGALELDNLISSADKESALGSYLERCSFTNTWKHALSIRHTTKNFRATDNVFFFTRGDGVRVHGPSHTIERNLVIAVSTPPECTGSVYKFVGSVTADCRGGAFRIAAGNTVVGNIASSGVAAGFVLDGDACGTATAVSRHEGNIARSQRDGVLVMDGPADTDYKWVHGGNFEGRCRWIRGYTTMDSADNGFALWYITGDLVLENFVSISNLIGVMPMLYYSGVDDGTQLLKASYKNGVVAGRWPGAACNADHRILCRSTLLDSQHWCKTFHSQAPIMGSTGILETVFLQSQFAGRTKGEHKFMWMEPDSYATIQGQASIDNVHFDGFLGTDAACDNLKSVAFYQNPYSNDTFHQHSFQKITWGPDMKTGGEFYARRTYGDIGGHQTLGVQSRWLDFDNQKFGAYWPDSPNKAWLVDIDGSFAKAGAMSNVIVSETLARVATFDKVGFDGQALRNPTAIGALRPGCTRNANWNAIVCDSRYQMVSLNIEHLGEDMMTRRAGPAVLCPGDGMITPGGQPVCNEGALDFASGPVMKGKTQRATLDRLVRLRFIAQQGGNYTLFFRGVPPAHMRLRLSNDEKLSLSAAAGVTLNIRYHGENAQCRVGIYVDGVRQKSLVSYSQPWAATPATTWPSSTDATGTNFHNKETIDGVWRNVLSVSLRSGKALELIQEPIVVVTMSVSMTVNDFFNNKDTFAAAMANVLGISADRMKFVNVVPGSTRRRLQATADVDIEIESNPTTVARASTSGSSASGDRTQASAQAATFARQEASAELETLLTKVSTMASTTVGGVPVATAASKVVTVTLTPPAIAFDNEKLSYITLNVSSPSNTFVQKDVQTAAASFVRSKFTTVPQSTTSLEDVGIAFVWTDVNTNRTRFTLSYIYDDFEYGEGYKATQAVLTALRNGQTVFPGYTVHDIKETLVVPPPAESPSSTDHTTIVIIGAVVGLVVTLVIALVVGIVVYFTCVKSDTKTQGQRAGDKTYEKKGAVESGWGNSFDGAGVEGEQHVQPEYPEGYGAPNTQGPDAPVEVLSPHDSEPTHEADCGGVNRPPTEGTYSTKAQSPLADA